jgi:hypothetical protein
MNPEIKSNIYYLIKTLTLEMRVENKGVVSLWRWDYKLDRLVRIK